ncbi:hypothetical protein NPIL_349521 [Nephila pilipes]|uniref:Uncharacterized protein n=1 Tax=Nephila pilipes TaxID=299642 RepID=A0A8X6PNJ9_NEPPI|nr:hypothetical protein NPIL_349521 [Nephila pilipes]
MPFGHKKCTIFLYNDSQNFFTDVKPHRSINLDDVELLFKSCGKNLNHLGCCFEKKNKKENVAYILSIKYKFTQDRIRVLEEDVVGRISNEH